jgi:IclR family transcriptional regulator, acetate operon repressor
MQCVLITDCVVAIRTRWFSGVFMAEELLIHRVLGIFDLLVGHPEGLPLTQIASQLKLPKSAAHRMLMAMIERGFVAQDAVSERYRLTLKLAALGVRSLAEMNIPEVCQPVLDRLAAKTGELIRMTLVEDRSLFWVAKAQGAHSGLRYDPDMGHRVVLHATSTGRAWLATLDDDEAVKIVLEHGFDVPARFNRHLICNDRDLRNELRRTRKRGYGLAIEEGEAGTAALAVVIFNQLDGNAVGTVSIAGPTVRLKPERLVELSGELKEAARELSALWPVREFHSTMQPAPIRMTQASPELNVRRFARRSAPRSS